MTGIVLDLAPDKREEEIINWAKEKRPDLVNYLSEIFGISDCRTATPADPVVIARVSFEAGRQFQNNNPDLKVDDNYSIYVK